MSKRAQQNDGQSNNEVTGTPNEQKKRKRRVPANKTTVEVNCETGVAYLMVPFQEETLYVPIDARIMQAVVQFTWFAVKPQNKSLGKAYISTLLKKSDGTQYRLGLHRFVHMYEHGELAPGLHIDHRDRDPLNNRLTNLRPLPPQLNAINSDRATGGTCKYPGVSWHGVMKKWRAITTVNKKQTVLGHFSSDKEAAQVVLQKLMEIHPSVDWNALAPEFYRDIPFIKPEN